MFKTFIFFIIQTLTLLFLTACATIPSDFEEPAVSVTSFKPVSSGGLTPEFEIILHVTNPNRVPLALEGMSYTIHLDGNKVMSGVANDLPTIEPYDEADVTLNARADLIGGFNLLTGLMNEHKEHLDYEFKAKLDIGTFMPLISVVKKGKLSINGVGDK
jgi:LEA14-like dessication related protein